MSLATRITTFFALLTMLISSSLSAFDMHQEVAKLEQNWAIAKFQTPKNQQLSALERLIQEAQTLNKHHPHQPAIMLWYGTILSTYASVKGGIAVLPQVKKARELLESSLALDENLNQGFAYGVLGTLYARVPGWPLSFGDKKKARKYLELAVKLNPNGIDSNYYFGDFLVDIGAHQQARKHLELALNTPIRREYELQDKGRKNEVATALAKLKRLGH